MRNITINFTDTKIGEVPRAQSGMYIDYDGSVAGDGDNITIRGGDNTSIHTISPIIPSGFYMSHGQRRSLMGILNKLAVKTDNAVISSENGALHEMCNAIYKNYCG